MRRRRLQDFKFRGNNRCPAYLKNLTLVVLLEIVGEDVGEHQGSPALTQDVDGLPQELHLDPRHVVLLHLVHLVLEEVGRVRLIEFR